MVFSGTIPAIIYYMVSVINPNFMIVLSFLVTGIVAVLIGTSWGTAGTVGIVMLSIASSMGVSMPMVAGAVISGAHVGQLLSPMSDTTNVAANLAQTPTMNLIKRISYYSIPVVIFAVAIYTVLGFAGGASGADVEEALLIRQEIKSVFNVNPLVILPMVLVFVMTFKKQPIIKSMLISAMVAIIFGTVFNGFSIWKGLDALFNGFDFQVVTGLEPEGYSDIFMTLVNRGGVMGMISSALLAIAATCYGGVMIKIGAVNVVAEVLFGRVKSRIGLVFSAIAVAGIVVALTTSAYLAILIASDLFKEKFHDAGMDDTDLISSCISASSQFVVCVPWVDTAIYMASISGVATMVSLPFNIFCWGNAVMAIILSMVGIGFANGRRFGKSA
jgi:NhaC family Na+:H+ antiporter